jgi:hypothetical protein
MTLKSLFQRVFSRERRQGDRQSAPGLAAYYWNGAAPIEHGIRDISSTGLFLVTEERWYPGTLVMMTLQTRKTRSDSDEEADHSVSVQSKSVRWGSDGVGLEFVLPDAKDPRRGQNLLQDGADRRGLEKFLQGFKAENGYAIVRFAYRPTYVPYELGAVLP